MCSVFGTCTLKSFFSNHLSAVAYQLMLLCNKIEEQEREHTNQCQKEDWLIFSLPCFRYVQQSLIWNFEVLCFRYVYVEIHFKNHPSAFLNHLPLWWSRRSFFLFIHAALHILIQDNDSPPLWQASGAVSFCSSGLQSLDGGGNNKKNARRLMQQSPPTWMMNFFCLLLIW